ncbi:MAG: hypothetical protein ACRDPO_35900, partial [Streptosporangiaceae bacterium]
MTSTSPSPARLPAHSELLAETTEILGRLGVPVSTDGDLIARSPVTGGELARLRSHTPAEVTAIIGAAQDAFTT